MKQHFAWAIVTGRKLALFDGRCPVYWRKFVAQAECDRHNTGRKEYRVEKVTILAVYGR